MQRTVVSQLLNQYGLEHQNPTNKKIHMICIPLIMWSLLGLLHAMPTPSFVQWPEFLGCDTLFVLFALIYYFYLNWYTGLLMLFIGFLLLSSLLFVAVWMPTWLIIISGSVFVLAWTGQFVGHHIEGSKPAFLTEIRMLLIGPLWTLNHFMCVHHEHNSE